MTDDERRALALKWDNLPPNEEWWIVHGAWQQLGTEGVIPRDRSVLRFLQGIVFMNEQSGDFRYFDLLVQRVLENKLLGVTE